MNQGTTLINAEEIYGSFYDPGECQDSKDGFEVKWEWPEEIGNGFISMIKLRPGLMLGIGDFRLIEDIAVSFEQKYYSVAFAFGFGVSGSMRCTVNSEEGQKGFWSYKPGHSVMVYQPEWQQGIAKPSVGAQVCYVGIYIDSLLLNTFMDGQHNHIPIGLRDIVNGAEEQYYYQASIMTPSVNVAIHQIINCPYQSSLKRLYLESKALELITYSMAQFVSPEATLKKDLVFQADDVERIREAGNILMGSLESPPSLLELASQVGVNKNKLNQGFWKIFGTSVFDHLRILRLERARELLESKEKNVTEVAFDVGYTHHGNFTRAFKNHFGTNPKDHLR